MSAWANGSMRAGMQPPVNLNCAITMSRPIPNKSAPPQRVSRSPPNLPHGKPALNQSHSSKSASAQPPTAPAWQNWNDPGERTEGRNFTEGHEVNEERKKGKAGN